MAGVSRERRLAAYLTKAARTPFTWGEFDCCLFIAGWAQAEAGVDPAAPLRGRYRTPIGALRHIRRAGGFLPLLRDLGAAAGLIETAAPIAGDVGVVGIRDLELAAIRTGLGWAMLTPNGYAVTSRAELLMGWRI